MPSDKGDRMSAAYYIVIERPIEGFDLFVDGKALAHANDLLDRLAADAGVKPLIDFFSMDPEEVDSLFSELGLDAEGTATDEAEPDADVPKLEEAPPEVWFYASEGLTTIQALIQAVQGLPAPEAPDPYEPAPDAILADLNQFKAVLDHLAAEGVRWHLMVDF